MLLLRFYRDGNGFLTERLKRPGGAVECMSDGNAQIAICWLKLFQDTGNRRYRDAALLTNGFVRRTVRFSGPGFTSGRVSLWLESAIASNGGTTRLQSSPFAEVVQKTLK
jgi:hypothetical protein